jgi:hypothetical protein
MSAKFWLEAKTLPQTTITVDSSSFANPPIHGGMTVSADSIRPFSFIVRCGKYFSRCLPLPGPATRIPAGKKRH